MHPKSGLPAVDSDDGTESKVLRSSTSGVLTQIEGWSETAVTLTWRKVACQSCVSFNMIGAEQRVGGCGVSVSVNTELYFIP